MVNNTLGSSCTLVQVLEHAELLLRNALCH